MDVGAAVVADEQPLELVKQAKVRSTTQRHRPSREPCPLLRRGPKPSTIIEGRFFHVIDMRDGTFLRCREYVDRAKAVASFKSTE